MIFFGNRYCQYIAIVLQCMVVECRAVSALAKAAIRLSAITTRATMPSTVHIITIVKDFPPIKHKWEKERRL